MMHLWVLNFVEGFNFNEHGLSRYVEIQGGVVRAPDTTTARLLMQKAADEWCWLDETKTKCEVLVTLGEPGVILLDTPTG